VHLRWPIHIALPRIISFNCRNENNQITLLYLECFVMKKFRGTKGNSMGIVPGLEGSSMQQNLVELGSARNEDITSQVAQPHPSSEGTDTGGEARTASENVQVGMVLLLDTLDCDPGLMEMQKDSASEKLSHHNADAIRLWAKHFAPLRNSGGIDIPQCWGNFMTNARFNPNNFEWAKTLLESKALSMIVNDSPSGKSVRFRIMTPLKNSQLYLENLLHPLQSKEEDGQSSSSFI
jgi:hypothetical protein